MDSFPPNCRILSLYGTTFYEQLPRPNQTGFSQHSTLCRMTNCPLLLDTLSFPGFTRSCSPTLSFFWNFWLSHVCISQNTVLFSTLFSFHTLSLDSPIYTCGLISKLNTDDFAQWFTLRIMQTSPINMSRREFLTFPKQAPQVFLITADGTASILSLKPETKDSVYTLTLSPLISNRPTNPIPIPSN